MLYLSSLIIQRPKLSMEVKCLSIGMAVCDLTSLHTGRYELNCSYYTLNIKRLNSINKQMKDLDDPSICKQVIPLNWRTLQIEITSEHFRHGAGDSNFTFCHLQHKEIAKPGFMMNTFNHFKIMFSSIHVSP